MNNKNKETDDNIKDLYEKLEKRNKGIQYGSIVMTSHDFAVESLQDISDAILKQLIINTEKELGVNTLPFWVSKDNRGY